MVKNFDQKIVNESNSLNKCPICGYKNNKIIFALNNIPISYSSPLEKNECGKEKLVDLKIVECGNCFHIYNSGFKTDYVYDLYRNKYSSGIANSKAVFDKYHFIIEKIIKNKNINNKIIVEIGASNLSFSKVLLSKNAKHIYAFDPSSYFKVKEKNITFINDFFNLDYLNCSFKEVNLVVMRHVLEHCPFPSRILEEISRLGVEGMKVYIEVPNVINILSNGRFYDFFYEHIHYFNPKFLKKFLSKFGLKTLETNFLADGQHFGILCEKSNSPILNDLCSQEFDSYSSTKINNFKKNMDYFKTSFDFIINKYEEIAIYGAGSHSLGIASILDLNKKRIKYFLDLDKYKSGKYSPKTNIPIFNPYEVNLNIIQAIIIIAPLYQEEIIRNLRSEFNYKNHIWATHPSIYLVKN